MNIFLISLKSKFFFNGSIATLKIKIKINDLEKHLFDRCKMVTMIIFIISVMYDKNVIQWLFFQGIEECKNWRLFLQTWEMMSIVANVLVWNCELLLVFWNLKVPSYFQLSFFLNLIQVVQWMWFFLMIFISIWCFTMKIKNSYFLMIISKKFCSFNDLCKKRFEPNFDLHWKF